MEALRAEPEPSRDALSGRDYRRHDSYVLMIARMFTGVTQRPSILVVHPIIALGCGVGRAFLGPTMAWETIFCFLPYPGLPLSTAAWKGGSRGFKRIASCPTTFAGTWTHPAFEREALNSIQSLFVAPVSRFLAVLRFPSGSSRQHSLQCHPSPTFAPWQTCRRHCPPTAPSSVST